MLATSIQSQLETDIHLHIFFWIIFTTILHFVIIFKNLLLNWIAEGWGTLLASINFHWMLTGYGHEPQQEKKGEGFSEEVYNNF